MPKRMWMVKFSVAFTATTLVIALLVGVFLHFAGPQEQLHTLRVQLTVEPGTDWKPHTEEIQNRIDRACKDTGAKLSFLRAETDPESPRTIFLHFNVSIPRIEGTSAYDQGMEFWKEVKIEAYEEEGIFMRGVCFCVFEGSKCRTGISAMYATSEEMRFLFGGGKPKEQVPLQ